MRQSQEIMFGDRRGWKKINHLMPNERPTCGIKRTPPMSLNHMIRGGVLPSGNQNRFLGLARKWVDLSDWTFSWSHISYCPSISRRHWHFSRWQTLFRGLKSPGHWGRGFNDENEPRMIIGKSLIKLNHAFEKSVWWTVSERLCRCHFMKFCCYFACLFFWKQRNLTGCRSPRK